MTNNNIRKLLYGIAAAVAVVAIVSYATMNNLPNAQGSVSTEKIALQPGIVMKEIKEPDRFIASGGRSAVKVEIPIGEITVNRGNTVDVDVHVKHIAGTNPFPFVIAKLIPPTGIYYPPTVASSTTPEQRMKAMELGKLIPGSINLNDLVSYSEVNPIKILPNSEQVVVMHVSIPKDAPNDVIGNDLSISIPIQVTDNNGNSDTIAWQNGRMIVHVVG